MLAINGLKANCLSVFDHFVGLVLKGLRTGGGGINSMAKSTKHDKSYQSMVP